MNLIIDIKLTIKNIVTPLVHWLGFDRYLNLEISEILKSCKFQLCT